jgi:hypothetical protein
VLKLKIVLKSVKNKKNSGWMELGRAAINSFSAYIRVQTFGKISASIHEFWVFF